MHIAQINVVRFKAPPGDPILQSFVDNIARINSLAEASPGFVWRFVEAPGSGPEFVAFEDGSVLGALSVWTSVGALKSFAYGEQHLAIIRRKEEWMLYVEARSYALWAIAHNERPTLAEGWRRLCHLRAHGDSEVAFGFAKAATFLPAVESTISQSSGALAEPTKR